MRRILGGCLTVLGLAACGGGTGDLTVAVGTWGGQNLELQVESGAATAQFKCGAIGRLNGPLALDASGHFTASGTYEPKLIAGGPRPAAFSGHVSVRSLSFSVEVEQTVIGPFELQQGQKGTFEPCNF